MGNIIGETEVQAREEYLDKKDRRENPAKYALIELKQRESEVTSELIKSAKEIFVKDGYGENRSFHGVADLRFSDSSHLVHHEEAQTMIAWWLADVEPDHKVTVMIGPDCSGNIQYAAQVVATFTPTN